MFIIDKKYHINSEIKVPQVRVISGTNEQLGVMATKDALQIAMDVGLDLVEISPNADPPVCRIIDYGKFQYLAAKRDKKAKQSQKNNDLKEIRLRPNIGENDLSAKMRKVREFIGNDSKVKLTVRFRGREMMHQQLGLNLLRRIANDLKEDIRLEKPPESQGRSISMVVMPIKRT